MLTYLTVGLGYWPQYKLSLTVSLSSVFVIVCVFVFVCVCVFVFVCVCVFVWFVGARACFLCSLFARACVCFESCV